MLKRHFNDKRCKELLGEYLNNRQVKVSKKIVFEGVEGFDVYNITAPFNMLGKRVIAGRVEKRDSEHSKVMFFEEKNDKYVLMKDAPVLELQDPFFTFIKDEIILGGVEIYPHKEIKGALGYRTVFFRGKDIYSLKRFTKGPEMMKDIRILDLRNGKIAVFTRPQGQIGGRGKIGFTLINSLDELNEDVIVSAPLIEGQFDEEEWGGANELHLLKNGLIGVLGHVACFDGEMNRHYYSMVFAFNPTNFERTPIKIIAVRDDFQEGESKRDDLKDVIFSGGLTRIGKGKAILYAGVSDAEAHQIEIQDPFLEYENLKV